MVDLAGTRRTAMVPRRERWGTCPFVSRQEQGRVPNGTDASSIESRPSGTGAKPAKGEECGAGILPALVVAHGEPIT